MAQLTSAEAALLDVGVRHMVLGRRLAALYRTNAFDSELAYLALGVYRLKGTRGKRLPILMLPGFVITRMDEVTTEKERDKALSLALQAAGETTDPDILMQDILALDFVLRPSTA